MFSKFAWKGLSTFFSTLNAIGYLPPFYYNPKTKEFEVNKNANHIFWLLSLLNVAITCCGIPLYAATTRLYGFGPAIRADLVIFFTLVFFSGIHALCLFIIAFLDASSWCHSLNELIKIEQYLRGMTYFSSVPTQSIIICFHL